MVVDCAVNFASACIDNRGTQCACSEPCQGLQIRNRDHFGSGRFGEPFGRGQAHANSCEGSRPGCGSEQSNIPEPRAMTPQQLLDLTEQHVRESLGTMERNFFKNLLDSAFLLDQCDTAPLARSVDGED